MLEAAAAEFAEHGIAEDLRGYAVSLYDSYLAAPDLIRLTSWNRLQRVPTGDLLHDHRELTQPKYDAIARAQGEGRLSAHCAAPGRRTRAGALSARRLARRAGPVAGEQ